ncbi:MAG: DNA-binding transcriptional regulator [Sedimentisphaerales bacterium]|nr:DNA-binding transcriptional regulator [Sedimentisphaerales bacterium]
MPVYPIPKVILLVETSTSYGRSLLRGIARYANLHGPWMIYREPPFYMDFRGWKKIKQRLLEWGANGLIIREPQRHKEMINMKVPLIVSPNQIPGQSAIVTDYEEIGKMAAEHFLERGFKNFAYCGYDEMIWSRNRLKGFQKTLAQKGLEVHVYNRPKAANLRLWENEQSRLAQWLKDLPKPIGLMACNDDRAQNIVETANVTELRVPEEIAVIGVDNDELTCSLTNPTISSVVLNPEKAGYKAASLLDQMMKGKKIGPQTIHDKPTHIITRQSTDIMSIDDPEVEKAVQFVKKDFKKKIQVTDVADAVFLSRRNLARRFSKVLGCSVQEKITQVRISEISRLLVDSDLSISQISEEMGFTGPEHFARYFKREKGLTPLAYRRQHRL